MAVLWRNYRVPLVLIGAMAFGRVALSIDKVPMVTDGVR